MVKIKIWMLLSIAVAVFFSGYMSKQNKSKEDFVVDFSEIEERNDKINKLEGRVAELTNRLSERDSIISVLTNTEREQRDTVLSLLENKFEAVNDGTRYDLIEEALNSIENDR